MRIEKCPDCEGTGILNTDEFGENIYCQRCGGSGEIVVEE